MKIGIVGTGMIVNEVLPVLSGIENVKCIGICGTERSVDKVNEFCEKYNLKGTTHYEQLLEMDIDTVYVGVPNNLHFDMCKLAIEKGMNVIVEKPIAGNIKETAELIRLAEENDVFIFEAITTQYLGSYQETKKWIKEIGDIKIISCNYSQYSSRYDNFCNGIVAPVFDIKKYGGALMDINLYNIHYVVGLVGEPKNVQYIANMKNGIDTSGVVTLEYDEFSAVCIGCKDCTSKSTTLIQGTKGYIVKDSAPNINGEVTLVMNDGTTKKYTDELNKHRMVDEFVFFEQIINNKDKVLYNEKIEVSKNVSKVMMQARNNANIVFDCDK